MKSKVAVIGAGGNIGIYVARGLMRDYDVIPVFHCYVSAGLTGEFLDITDSNAVREFIKAKKPEIVVNLAAIADPDVCEKNPALAEKVNVDGAHNLAQACDEAGAYFIHYSTDLVFDGKKGMYTEDDIVNPLNVYAKTKARSEKAVLAVTKNAAVLRTAIVFGKGAGKRKNFFEHVVACAREGRSQKLFIDQYRSFFYVGDSSLAVKALIENRSTGLYHLGGAHRGRYEFTLDILKRMGLPTGMMEGVKMDDVASHALRPKDCSLDSSRFKRETGFAVTPFPEAVQKFKVSLGFV
ncbi:hypothetical protein MNBD_NITROSPINAE01-738 [hydrothermal vent metagenome]|uniref:RmlD-like substrate binding domain-containing protein n=1 Tax=hydrothermal vent metagenome TaxID=652676 RepID=A0A3B1BGM1_9ZZZZ